MYVGLFSIYQTFVMITVFEKNKEDVYCVSILQVKYL